MKEEKTQLKKQVVGDGKIVVNEKVHTRQQAKLKAYRIQYIQEEIQACSSRSRCRSIISNRISSSSQSNNGIRINNRGAAVGERNIDQRQTARS